MDFPRQTPTHTHTSGLPDSSAPGGTPAPSCGRIITEESHRAPGGPSINGGFLQPTVPGPQTYGGVQTSHRPVNSEHSHSLRSFPHGDHRFNTGGTPAGRVDLHGRHKGCVPSYTGAPRIPEIPQVHSVWQNVPVHSSTVWPFSGSANIYNDPPSYSRVAASKEHQSTCIPGRLAGTNFVTVQRQPGWNFRNRAAATPRLGYQLVQVRPQWYTVPSLPRTGIPATGRHGSPWSQSKVQYAPLNLDAGSGPPHYGAPFRSCSRETQTLGSVHTPRSLTPEGSTRVAETELESVPRTMVGPPDPELSTHSVTQVVSPERSMATRRSLTSPSPSSGSPDGRVHFRLGSIPQPGDTSQRCLDTDLATTSHKHSRNEGSVAGLPGIQAHTQGEIDTSTRGQHSGGCSPEKGGGHKVKGTHADDPQLPVLVRPEQCSGPSSSHCGSPQRDGGWTLPTGPAASQRVVPVTGGVHPGLRLLGTTGGRLDGNGSQPTGRQVYISDPTHGSPGSRCLRHAVAGSQSPILIPTVNDSDSSNSTDTRTATSSSRSDSIHESDAPILSGPSQDGTGPTTSGLQRTRNPSATADRRNTNSVPRVSKTVQSGGVVNNRPPHPVVSSNRLDTISSIMRSKGIAEKVIDYAKRPQRVSSAAVYDGQWNAFVDFCRANQYDPLSGSESNIAEYLLSMFERNCAPATIKVHRAAISSVLKHLHPDISKNALIGDIITRFDQERPRTKQSLPKFCIDTVLEQLMKPPFIDSKGTDHGITKLLYAYKLAFLLGMATGARSSELHALSRDPRLCKITLDKDTGKQTLTVYTRPGFVRKNELPQAERVPFVIPSLKHMVGPNEKERFLCPVRAVLVYRARTPDGAYPADNELLLRHPTPGVSTKSSVIALWIRKCIEIAYDTAKLDKTQVNAHEVRAVALSLRHYHNATLEEVCEGGKWRSKQSFFNHYLRTMAGTEAGSSIPVVAGGKLLGKF